MDGTGCHVRCTLLVGWNCPIEETIGGTNRTVGLVVDRSVGFLGVRGDKIGAGPAWGSLGTPLVSGYTSTVWGYC